MKKFAGIALMLLGIIGVYIACEQTKQRPTSNIIVFTFVCSLLAAFIGHRLVFSKMPKEQLKTLRHYWE